SSLEPKTNLKATQSALISPYTNNFPQLKQTIHQKPTHDGSVNPLTTTLASANLSFRKNLELTDRRWHSRMFKH
ncbi:MAG: hypothetical protein Q7O66_02430, partial [Dehalococcoidia bacterium]|nr:hypothetical protein [Dehalococcoidia bacterium]